MKPPPRSDRVFGTCDATRIGRASVMWRIDESARALAATLKDDYKRGLTQEIQEHVVKIYEACNFQDLSGQRIGHVIETLNMIENQVEDMLERHSGQPGVAPAAKPGHALLNGPRLDGVSGHTSQRDIDKMFRSAAR